MKRAQTSPDAQKSVAVAECPPAVARARSWWPPRAGEMAWRMTVRRPARRASGSPSKQRLAFTNLARSRWSASRLEMVLEDLASSSEPLAATGREEPVLGTGEVEDVPVVTEGGPEEETHATEVDGEGAASDFLADQADEVGPDVVLVNPGQWFGAGPRETPGGAGVGLDGALGLSGEAKVCGQTLEQLIVSFHGALLLGRGEFGFPALPKECAFSHTHATSNCGYVPFRRRRIAFNKSLQRSSITVINVAIASLAATLPPAIAAAEFNR